MALGVLEARNLSNPTLSNAVVQCGVGDARVRLRARGTLLLDLPIVACLPHAIRDRIRHRPTLRSTSLRLCGVIRISCLRHAKSMSRFLEKGKNAVKQHDWVFVWTPSSASPPTLTTNRHTLTDLFSFQSDLIMFFKAFVLCDGFLYFCSK